MLDLAPNRLERNRQPDLGLVGDIDASLAAIREAADGEAPQTTASGPRSGSPSCVRWRPRSAVPRRRS